MSQRTRTIKEWALVDKIGRIEHDLSGRAFIYDRRFYAEDQAAAMNPEHAVRVRRIYGKVGKGRKR